MSRRLIMITFTPLLILAGAAIAWQVTGFGLGYWLQVHFGIVNEGGPYYGFFSGSGSDLGEIALAGTLVTLIAGLWHKWNCHKEKCWRIGLHQLAGGQYLVCRKHHGSVTGHSYRKLTVEFLRQQHHAHLAATGHRDHPEDYAE